MAVGLRSVAVKELHLELPFDPCITHSWIVFDFLLNRLGFAILGRRCCHGPLGGDAQRFDLLTNVVEIHSEEFLAVIDLVELHHDEVLVKLAFKRGSVFAVDHGVDIEPDRDAGVTQLVNSVLGLEPPGEPDLVHVIPEGPDIGDDVNVAAPGLLGH